MKLLIAIPAYNEQDSIASVIERTLAAREVIMTDSPVAAVDVTVVSDGSTDRTVAIAERYWKDIRLIVFDRNRGYGAAVKEAWRGSDAELLGFLDADGTCDPRFFAVLARALVERSADVALGSRVGARSRMPLVRRVGNAAFALLLSVFSSKRVADTASGMRIIRRESLARLMPLPDGLHFTPAMSARALVSGLAQVVEVPMSYAERDGVSKLRVVRDGLRFARTILEASLLYRPSRPLVLIGLACLAAAVGLMVLPIIHYLQFHSVEAWMIYRFITSSLLGMTAWLLAGGAYLARRVVAIAFGIEPRPDRHWLLVGRVLCHRAFWLVPATLLAVAGYLVLPSFLQLVRTGATYEHWSRFVVASFLGQTAVALIVVRLLDHILTLASRQLAFRRNPEVTSCEGTGVR